jgi:hypothetical protein
MITSQDHCAYPIQRTRWTGSLASRHPGGQIFQSPERTGGLRQGIQPAAGLGVYAGRRWSDHVKAAGRRSRAR